MSPPSGCSPDSAPPPSPPEHHARAPRLTGWTGWTGWCVGRLADTEDMTFPASQTATPS